MEPGSGAILEEFPGPGTWFFARDDSQRKDELPPPRTITVPWARHHPE